MNLNMFKSSNLGFASVFSLFSPSILIGDGVFERVDGEDRPLRGAHANRESSSYIHSSYVFKFG